MRGVLSLVILLGLAVIGVDSTDHTEAYHSSETCQPDGPDPDSDGLANWCDPANGYFDFDGDGASDSLEVFLGSNPLYSCPTPTDFNGSGITTTTDVGFFTPAMGSTIGQEPYERFLDLTASESINTIDVGKFVPVLNKPGCPTNPTLNAVPHLYPQNKHIHEAPRFESDTIFVKNTDDDPLFAQQYFCDFVQEAGALWSDTRIRIEVQILKSGPDCTWFVGPSIEIFVAPIDADGEYHPYGLEGQDCLADPCQEATFGSITINEDPLLFLDEPGLLRLMQHEMGHALGMDHPDGDLCQTWTTLAYCAPSVRLNDLMFSRIKY